MSPAAKTSWRSAEAAMIAGQAWVLLALLPLPEPLRPYLLILGACLLPGFQAGLLLSQGRASEAWMIGFCLAPVSAGCVGLLAIAAGMDAKVSALLLVLATLPLAGWAGAHPAARPSPRRDGTLPAWLLGFALAGLSLLLLSLSLRIRLSSHGLLHSAITYRILDSGIPPENPFFAGEPLRYYWFYQLGAAGLSLLSGKSPLILFGLLNVFALAAALPCLHRTARSLGLDEKTSLLGAALGLLALNPMGPLFYLLNAPGCTLADIEGGTSPSSMVQALAMGFDLRLASPLTKFWNVSSFPPAVALFLMGFFAALLHRGAPVRRGILLFLAAFGAVLINPLAGMCLIAAAGAGSAAWLIRREMSRLLVTLAALAAAGAASLPYLRSMSGGGRAGPPMAALQFDSHPLLGVLLAAGPVLLFAGFGARMLARKARGETLFLVLSCAFLLAPALCLWLPMNNEYKIIRLIVFPAGLLAAPAAMEFLRRMRLPRAVNWVLVAAVLVPNSLIAFTIYWHGTRADLPMRDDGVQIAITAADPEREEAYRFLREETPPGTVVVVDPKDRKLSLGGDMQGDEVPALARRALYTGHMFYLTESYPDFQDRIERTARLFLDKEGPLPEPLEGRPLAVLVRSMPAPACLKPPAFEEVFHRGDTAIFLFRPREGGP